MESTQPLLSLGFSIRGRDIGEAKDCLALRTPLLRSITVDHSTEFTYLALEDWAWQHGV